MAAGERRPPRWRRALVVAVALVVLAVAAGDPTVRWAANRWAGRATAGCAHVSGLRVALGSWPADVRVAAGALNDVSATADTVTVGSLVARDLNVHVGRVTFSPAGLVTGEPRVSVHDGVARVRVAAGDLDAYLRSRGLPGRVLVDADGVSVVAVGVRVPLSVRPERSGLVIAPAGPLGSALAFRLSVPGVSVLDVRPEPAALGVTARVDGRVDTLACAARRALG